MPPRRIQPAVRVVTPGPGFDSGADDPEIRPATEEVARPRVDRPVDTFTVPSRPVLPPVLPRDFSSPRVHLEIPTVLGRPPNSDDVQVIRGFDGLTPDQAVAKIASNLGDPVHASNRAFVDETIRGAHKAFTVAVNNAFIPGSPVQRRFHQMQNPVAIVATMSAIHPTLIEVRHGAQPTYYARTGSGFERVDNMRYPVILRADLMWHPAAGVRVTHPGWRAPVLSDRTATIIEG